MGHFVCRRVCLLLLLAVVAAVVVTVALPAFALGSESPDHSPATIDQVYDIVNPEMSGDNAYANVAYVWRGWRNAGGPWFNQVMDWIGGDLASDGFVEGKTPADPTAAHYWTQMDYRSGSIWVPQYLSMQIVGPEGDAVAGDPAAYHFDHPAVDTFDPTSAYYPSYMTQDWILSHVGTPEEAAIGDRCHLATSSAFTAPMDTPVSVAETAEGGAIVADVVDVGTVTGSGSATRTWSNHSTTSLAGKILFSATASISNLMTLASQQSAKAVMSSSALSAYSDPIIDGAELYPNNVRFSGGGSSAAPTRITLNISRDDVRFLTALCAKYDETSSFPQMKLFAIGGTKPYSVSPATDNMLPTVIAEIPGTDSNPVIANQRVVYGAHVQEPGACDNATGVATLLEMVRSMKHLIDTGALPAPRRTMTFIWGNETIMGSLWKGQNPEAFASTQIFIDLDMVGEDSTKTGGPMRIEKMPDPSARYKYQLDKLPADPAPTPTQFLRQPDSHTLWGAGSLKFWPYPGHYLNDTYFYAANKVKAGSPHFNVVGNPWEGGSDHDTFLWNQDDGVYNPKPAVLTWHFTDYVYHSSEDTMDKVSKREMHDVGVTSILAGYDVALADVDSADKTIDIVKAAADQRFGWEEDNTKAHLLWALVHPYGEPATTDAALHEAYEGTGNSSTRSIGESQLLREWGAWYEEAVISARTIFDPADSTPAYHAHETAAVAAVAADAAEAQANAAHLLAVFHFSSAAVAIDGGATASNTRDVGLTLAAASVAPGGVTGMRFSDDGKTWPAEFTTFAGTSAYTLPAGDGAKTVFAQFQDSEGNISDPVSATIKLDMTGPTATIGGAPAGWVNHSVPLTFSGADGDGAGVDFVEYRIGDGAWAKGDAVTVSAEGTTVVACRATDLAGNVGPEASASVSIDTSKPRLTLTLSGPKRSVVRRGGDVKAKCAVTPTRLASSRVTLTVERKYGARWVKVKSGSATIRATMAYGWRYKAPRTGTYRLRARLDMSAANAAAKTAWHRFTVK